MLSEFLQQTLTQIGRMGWAGPAVFALFYLGATLLFVPTVLLAFALASGGGGTLVPA